MTIYPSLTNCLTQLSKSLFIFSLFASPDAVGKRPLRALSFSRERIMTLTTRSASSQRLRTVMRYCIVKTGGRDDAEDEEEEEEEDSV
jgi:hypothetical protein